MKTFLPIYSAAEKRNYELEGNFLNSEMDLPFCADIKLLPFMIEYVSGNHTITFDLIHCEILADGVIKELSTITINISYLTVTTNCIYYLADNSMYLGNITLNGLYFYRITIVGHAVFESEIFQCFAIVPDPNLNPE